MDENGKILAHSLPNISHQELVSRTFRDGLLPAGNYAVSIGKDSGAIYVLNSNNFRRGGLLPPQAVVDGIKEQVH